MASNNFVVIYDACVLYPANLRDLLLHLALTNLFKAKWSDDIHREWIENLLANRPDLKMEKLYKTKELMEKAIPDAHIPKSRYQEILSSISLPDPNDNHVLAAAIVCQAQVIVTFNLKDFPKNILSKYEIEAIHPDDFICHLINLSPENVLDSIFNQIKKLKNPPIEMESLIKIHKKSGLHKSMQQIEIMLNI